MEKKKSSWLNNIRFSFTSSIALLFFLIGSIAIIKIQKVNGKIDFNIDSDWIKYIWLLITLVLFFLSLRISDRNIIKQWNMKAFGLFNGSRKNKNIAVLTILFLIAPFAFLYLFESCTNGVEWRNSLSLIFSVYGFIVACLIYIKKDTKTTTLKDFIHRLILMIDNASKGETVKIMLPTLFLGYNSHKTLHNSFKTSLNKAIKRGVKFSFYQLNITKDFLAEYEVLLNRAVMEYGDGNKNTLLNRLKSNNIINPAVIVLQKRIANEKSKSSLIGCHLEEYALPEEEKKEKKNYNPLTEETTKSLRHFIDLLDFYIKLINYENVELKFMRKEYYITSEGLSSGFFAVSKTSKNDGSYFLGHFDVNTEEQEAFYNGDCFDSSNIKNEMEELINNYYEKYKMKIEESTEKDEESPAIYETSHKINCVTLEDEIVEKVPCDE